MKTYKYILFFLLTFFALLLSGEANSKVPVNLFKCVDGDTTKFYLNNEEITVRFLAIDTPETKHPTKGEEPFGKEASNFTCDTLNKASKIELEYDSNSDQKDRYDRHLAWIWVDDILLQDLLIQNGLAKVAYLYDDYTYTPLLLDHQETAKKNQVGIWQDQKAESINYEYLILGLLIIIFIYIIGSKKTKKKIRQKIKKELKKKI